MAQRLRDSWLTREWAGAPAWMLALLVVVALGVGAIAVSTTAEGTQTAATPTPSASPSVSASAEPDDGGVIRAVFLGDSYTQGIGASDPESRWSTLVAGELGWVEINLGRGGTGYKSTSDATGCGRAFCPNYAGMVASAVLEQPDVVVVAGGQNDFGPFEEDPSSGRGAIDFAYDALRDALPEARIIAIGPSTPRGVTPTVVEFDEAVQVAAERVDGVYISLIDPDVFADTTLIADDEVHANNEGHAAIAARVLAALGG